MERFFCRRRNKTEGSLAIGNPMSSTHDSLASCPEGDTSCLDGDNIKQVHMNMEDMQQRLREAECNWDAAIEVAEQASEEMIRLLIAKAKIEGKEVEEFKRVAFGIVRDKFAAAQSRIEMAFQETSVGVSACADGSESPSSAAEEGSQNVPIVHESGSLEEPGRPQVASTDKANMGERSLLDLSSLSRPCLDWEVAKQHGNDAFKCGDYSVALEYYKISIATHVAANASGESLGILHSNAAQCCLHQGWLELARKHCEDSLAVNPNSQKTLFRRARVLELQHETFKALTDFQKIQELDPNCKTAAAKVATIQSKLSSTRKKVTTVIIDIASKATLAQASKLQAAPIVAPSLGLTIEGMTQNIEEGLGKVVTEQSLASSGQGELAIPKPEDFAQAIASCHEWVKQHQGQRLVMLPDVDLVEIDALLLDLSATNEKAVARMFMSCLLAELPAIEDTGANPFKYLLFGFEGLQVLVPFQQRMLRCREILTAAISPIKSHVPHDTVRQYIHTFLSLALMQFRFQIDPLRLMTIPSSINGIGLSDLAELVWRANLDVPVDRPKFWEQFCFILNWDVNVTSQQVATSIVCSWLHTQQPKATKLENLVSVASYVEKESEYTEWLDRKLSVGIHPFLLDLCVLPEKLAMRLLQIFRKIKVSDAHRLDRLKAGEPLPVFKITAEVGSWKVGTEVVLAAVMSMEPRGTNYLFARRAKPLQVEVGSECDALLADGRWVPVRVTSILPNNILAADSLPGQGMPAQRYPCLNACLVRKRRHVAQAHAKHIMLVDEGPFKKGDIVTLASQQVVPARGVDYQFLNAKGDAHWIFSDLYGRYFEAVHEAVEDSQFIWADLEDVVFQSLSVTGSTPQEQSMGHMKDASVVLSLLIDVASRFSMEHFDQFRGTSGNDHCIESLLESFQFTAMEILTLVDTLQGLVPQANNERVASQTPIEMIRESLEVRSKNNHGTTLRQTVCLLKQFCSSLESCHASLCTRQMPQRLLRALRDPLWGWFGESGEPKSFSRSLVSAIHDDPEMFDIVGVKWMHLATDQRAALRAMHTRTPELTSLMVGLAVGHDCFLSEYATSVSAFHEKLRSLTGGVGLNFADLEVELIRLLGAPVLAESISKQLQRVGALNNSKEADTNTVSHRNQQHRDPRKEERSTVWSRTFQVIRQSPILSSSCTLTKLVKNNIVYKIHRWAMTLMPFGAVIANNGRELMLKFLGQAAVRGDQDVPPLLSSLDALVDFMAQLMKLQVDRKESRGDCDTILVLPFSLGDEFSDGLLASLFNWWTDPDILMQIVFPTLLKTHERFLAMAIKYTSAVCGPTIFQTTQIMVYLNCIVQMSQHTFRGNDKNNASSTLARTSEAFLAFAQVIVESEVLSKTIGAEGDVLKQVLQFLPRYSSDLWYCTSGIEKLVEFLKAIRSSVEYEALSTALQRVSSYEEVASAQQFLVDVKSRASVHQILMQAATDGHSSLLDALFNCQMFRIKSSMDFCWQLVQQHTAAMRKHEASVAVAGRASFVVLACMGCDLPHHLVKVELDDDFFWTLVYNLRFGESKLQWVVSAANRLAEQLSSLVNQIQEKESFGREQHFHKDVVQLISLMREMKNAMRVCRTYSDVIQKAVLDSVRNIVAGLLQWRVQGYRSLDDAGAAHALLALAQCLSSFLGLLDGPTIQASRVLLSTCIRISPDWQTVRFSSDLSKGLPIVYTAPTPTELSKRVQAYGHNIMRPHSLEQSPWMVARSIMLKVAETGSSQEQTQEPLSTGYDEHATVQPESIVRMIVDAYVNTLDSYSRFVPLPALYPVDTVLFRGLGDRDGKQRAAQSVVDLLCCGMTAADLSQSNPFGQTSSKAGQLFFTHVLNTGSGAMFYLTDDFSDGALIALDAQFANNTILQGDYRFELEVVLHLTMYEQVPLSAVVALFLPSKYEHDIRLVYLNDDPTSQLTLPEFRVLTKTQLLHMRAGLQSTQEGQVGSFFERVVNFVPPSEEPGLWLRDGQDLFQYVCTELSAQGRTLLQDTGHAMMLSHICHCEQEWKQYAPAIVAELAHQLPTCLTPRLLPSSDASGMSCWIREVFSESNDDQFAQLFPITEAFLPALVRLQDLIPQRVKVSSSVWNKALQQTGGFIHGWQLGVKEQERRLPSLFQLVRQIFTPMRTYGMVMATFFSLDDLEGLAAVSELNFSETRLLARAAGLLVMLPEVVRHLQQHSPHEHQDSRNLQEMIIKDVSESLWEGQSGDSGRNVMRSFSQAMLVMINVYVELFWTVRKGVSAFSHFWSVLRKISCQGVHETPATFQLCSRSIWAIIWRLLWARVAVSGPLPSSVIELRNALRQGDGAPEGLEASKAPAQRLVLIANLYIGSNAMLDV